MDTILVANAGSSSVKFQVFAVEADGKLKRQVRGQVDGVGTSPRLRATGADRAVLVDRAFQGSAVQDVSAALSLAGTWLREELQIHPVAIGHRVVHGGPDNYGPVRLDAEMVQQLERYIPLAPLHQPYNLAPIRSILERFPAVVQVACFDTAFHRTHSAFADRYAIPEDLYSQGVRRYGFHGVSYEYIASVLPDIAPALATGRVIVAHLGSGASMCAIDGGYSVESTMGFTALDGLPMGTRPGQIDAGVVLFLIQQRGMSGSEVERLLYRECGLKGLSGISNDMRQLQDSSEPRAILAVDYFVYRVGLNAGLLAAAMQGVDGFVFTAGIGENSPKIRAAIAAKLGWLGVSLDPVANADNRALISRPDSRIPVHVVPTDEELMIARHTLSLLRGASSGQHSKRRAS